MLHRTRSRRAAHGRRPRCDRGDGPDRALLDSTRCSCSPASPATSPIARCAGARPSGATLRAAGGTDSQRGDLGAPLIALGARVRSTGAGGERDRAGRGLPRRRPQPAARARDRVRPLRAPDRRERASAAATPTRSRSQVSSPAPVPTAASLRVAVCGVGPTAVRCRTVEASRDAADVLEDVAARRRRRRIRRLPPRGPARARP